MKAKQIVGGASVTCVAILDQGEEAFSALADWAARQQVPAAQVTAVGAFEQNCARPTAQTSGWPSSTWTRPDQHSSSPAQRAAARHRSW
jgi:hypothetical protein